MSRRLLLLASPDVAAGSPRERRLWRLVEHLKSFGHAVSCVHAASLEHARHLAREAAPHFDGVIAAGGDGTTRAVAGGLLGARGESRAALGLAPLGTGNDLSDQLGVGHWTAAIEALRAGREQRLDVIEVTHPAAPSRAPDYALMFAAAGFAPALLARTRPRLKRWLGRSGSYTAGFFLALIHFRAPWLRVWADGQLREGYFFHVCAGNSERAGGGLMRHSPGARMNDGRLELCLIEALSRWEVTRNFPRLIRGTFPGHPRVSYQPGRELVVESDRPQPLALDGDVVGVTPVRWRVRPGALRVITPEP